MEHYLAQAAARRQHVPEPDVTLTLLRQAFYSFLGIKEGEDEKKLDEQLKTVGAPQVTKEESDAWLKAGMPGPLSQWVARYRNDHRSR